jgi:hypothetical protein
MDCASGPSYQPARSYTATDRDVVKESTEVTDGIFDFPDTSTEATTTDRILVQLRLTNDFTRLVDRWRADRDISRTGAVYELCALGLAGEMLKVNTKAIRQRSAELQK